ncbi:hypothetical protein F4604DRAFT_1750824 [Suillus subluteus]|nr:hypothetical protein F4604DRAFT_1750824 [Suillus subluteus]
MTLLLCAFLFCIPFVIASLPILNDTCIHTLDASNSPSCNARTLWDILSSCGLTLFACTWTAVHPDIPHMDQGTFSIAIYRLRLMVIALLAPELVTACATLQFSSAHQAAKNFNDAFGPQCARLRAIWQRELAVTLLGDFPNSSRSSRTRWTLTHGFFARMGGFVLYVDGEPWATLTPNELLRFVRDGSVEIPVITKADIEDRSKGDVLSKCVAILQLVWFVVQLIARYSQNLPVTLLEIDTLGVTALSCISYGLWLKKPKDIKHPYIVHWNSEATAPPPADSLTNKHYYSRQWKTRKPPHMVFGGDRKPIDSGSTMMISLITGCISGMGFGAIHCLGWNFLFTGHIQQILWDVASIGMICSPPLVLLFFSTEIPGMMDILPSEYRRWTSHRVPYFLQVTLFYTGVIFFQIYFVARVTIFVLMFLSLRSLPPGAYDTVAWTNFIPHVNL